MSDGEDLGARIVIRGIGTDIPVLLSVAANVKTEKFPYICIEHGTLAKPAMVCEGDFRVVEPDKLRQAMVRRDKSYVVIEDTDRKKLLAIEDDVLVITETRSLARFDPEWVKRSYWAHSDAVPSRALASLWQALDREQLIAMGAITQSGHVRPAAVRAVTHGQDEKLLAVMRLYWPAEMSNQIQDWEIDAKPEAGDVLAMRDALVRLDQSDRPMLEGVRNGYAEALALLVSEREESDRVRTARLGQLG